MENFNDKLDAIFEVIENIPADASYIPTVEELRKNKVEKDIEKYLLELNEISDSDSSVRISKLLIEKQYIQYLRRDDVFEHVKLRLWEIVSKNKGYKGSFTRKRNKFVKNPVLVKNPHSNIKYPYVK